MTTALWYCVQTRASNTKHLKPVLTPIMTRSHWRDGDKKMSPSTFCRQQVFLSLSTSTPVWTRL